MADRESRPGRVAIRWSLADQRTAGGSAGVSGELIVTCACGFEAREKPEKLIPIVQQHGRDVHNMDSTAEEVLALARPVDHAPSGPGTAA